MCCENRCLARLLLFLADCLRTWKWFPISQSQLKCRSRIISTWPRFTAELLASLLSIPTSKSLLRRHLSIHVKALCGQEAIQVLLEMNASKFETESKFPLASISPYFLTLFAPYFWKAYNMYNYWKQGHRTWPNILLAPLQYKTG